MDIILLWEFPKTEDNKCSRLHLTMAVVKCGQLDKQKVDKKTENLIKSS